MQKRGGKVHICNRCVSQMCMLAVLLLLSSSNPKSNSLVSHRGTDASHNFPYNCYSAVCSDIATVKSAFPPVLWHSALVVLFPLDVPHHKFKLSQTEPIISIDKTMVTPAQAAKNLVWLQLLCESHMAATAWSQGSLCSATYLESNPSFLTRPSATNGC